MTNYSEFQQIESFLKTLKIPIASLEACPRTIEKGITALDFPVKIPVESVGPIAPIFKEISVKIYWSTDIYQDKRFTQLHLDYSYEHPGGSNGYRTEYYSVDGSTFGDYDTALSLIRR